MSKTKTMRNIWDERMKIARGQKVAPRPSRVLSKHDQESLIKQQKYFLEHVERRKMMMDFFPEYYAYLNQAGFNKKVESLSIIYHKGRKL